MAFDVGTPINTALLLFILYSVQKIVFPSTSLPKEIPHEFRNGYSWLPKSHQPTVLFKTYTPKTLAPFHGKDNGRILLAINGIVFDVTAGRNFYGPRNFAGRDASKGMAKQSFDLDMLTPIDQPLDKLTDLQPDEIDNMKGWVEHFSNKYIVCGKLVENDVA
ncbi:cytochrome b5-like heme/steroid binding domain-containing protein [Lentinula detonsa]|uniref:Cytochrome b5-like heme/steroid binding domain-containing protein n=1 Tax=Lentinula detonsa TaxID=2804962 RepID=A0A9W8NRD5_9AGAR|nr:cytochrome b5-like heme/steroid binding domain-containing protein [Lentinula detonsa]